MSLPLPIPTLDHVVVNVRDRLDDAQAAYRRLGFTLTPRGYHTLGSMNHLAILGTHYLELIAAGPSQRSDVLDQRSDIPSQRSDILNQPAGLNGLVFGAENCAGVHDALAAAGVAVQPAQQFSRPVNLVDGPQDAVFRTVHLAPDLVGRLYFCEHLTRNLVWRDEWRRHPNGAIGISRFVFAARDPRHLGGLFGRMFGHDAVRTIPDGLRLLAELVDIDIITPDAVTAQFGVEVSDTREDYMAALSVRVNRLENTRHALSGVAHEIRGDRVVLPPQDAMGTILAFHE